MLRGLGYKNVDTKTNAKNICMYFHFKALPKLLDCVSKNLKMSFFKIWITVFHNLSKQTFGLRIWNLNPCLLMLRKSFLTISTDACTKRSLTFPMWEHFLNSSYLFTNSEKYLAHINSGFSELILAQCISNEKFLNTFYKTLFKSRIQTWADLLGFLTLGIPQCGNLAIFLRLWFYVKSILADFRRSITTVLTILQALNFDFLENFTLEM